MTAPPRQRRPSTGDDGIAMASVMILGMILAILAMVIVARATSNYTVTDSDRRWEQSLFVAESGLDVALVEMQDDAKYATVPGTADLSTRNDIIAAAAVLAADPRNRIATPGGEVVIVKPAGIDVVYAVGASPGWDVSTRKVRVVRAELGNNLWRPQFNLLVGGDLKVEAQKKDKDVEMLGSHNWAHANGKIEAKKGVDDIHGCLTAWGAGAPGQKWSNQDTPECPSASDVIGQAIPVIDPMKVHYLAQYDICPDGTLRYGPASGHPSAAAAGIPCSGGAVANSDSFKIKDLKDGKKVAEIQGHLTPEGIYFALGRNVKVKLDHTFATRHYTVFTARVGGDLSCSNRDPANRKLEKEQYGDVEIDSHRSLRPHPNARGYLVVAVGDVKLKLKHKEVGEALGMVFAHEQVKLESQDSSDDPTDTETAGKGGIRGFVVAESACDTVDSKVQKKSELKKGDIFYDGQYGSEEFRVGPLRRMLTRNEL